MRQVEDTRNATIDSSAFRNKLALSGIAEYVVRASEGPRDRRAVGVTVRFTGGAWVHVDTEMDSDDL